jgi:hypothetical protein
LNRPGFNAGVCGGGERRGCHSPAVGSRPWPVGPVTPGQRLTSCLTPPWSCWGQSAAGHVGDESGEYTGVWTPYRLGGQDVGTEVRRLWHYGLIHKPLVGPPTLSAEGWARIDTEADPF